jgi:RimJ/RimL family protein N-acetyltransferase
MLTIQAMTEDDAREMLSWHYEPPYTMYSMDTVSEDDMPDEIAYLLNAENHFYAIYNDQNEMVGHCVFHAEARVRGDGYAEDALDVGIGMRPDMTGQGQGTAITAQVLNFAKQQYAPSLYRATIAAWNKRAQVVCLKNGFRKVREFDSDDGRRWVVLLKEVV